MKNKSNKMQVRRVAPGMKSTQLINSKKRSIRKVAMIGVALCFATLFANAQSVTQLRSGYGTSKTTWNAGSGTLTFTKSGAVKFKNKGKKSWLWDVPKEVKKIVINPNVTVNGGFHFKHTMTIEGKNRNSSKIFGTNQRNWADNNKIKAFTIATIHCKGGVGTLKNFTMLNPRAFHVLGNGGKCHISNCSFIDNRGGGGNHSDGYAGGAGSTINNCYFETGDDVIKLYNNITVTNTTIKMVQNCVPIQLGWGNTGNDVGTFRNITITGNSGRGNDSNAIIVGRTGRYTKTVNIDGLVVKNPNASWASLRVKGQVLKGNVTNADIKIKKYWGYKKGKSQMRICGTTAQKTVYKCRKKSAEEVELTNAQSNDATLLLFPNPATDNLQAEINTDKPALLTISSLNGQVVQSARFNNGLTSLDISSLQPGMYVVIVQSEDNIMRQTFIKQ